VTPALTADTSVVVAGLSAWHPAHSAARSALDTLAWLPVHVLAETVSVLSRLPRGQALSAVEAVELIRPLAGGHAKQVPAARYLPAFESLGRAGLTGGAVHDAIVAATAMEHDATLLSLDRRARRTYAAVGARYELIG
jgi:predicted nucleic acid-binding protein